MLVILDHLPKHYVNINPGSPTKQSGWPWGDDTNRGLPTTGQSLVGWDSLGMYIDKYLNHTPLGN